MLASKEELNRRVNIMSKLCVSEKHKKFLIDSVNDGKCDDFIMLIDILSSTAWWVCASSGTEGANKRMEAHLEARKNVIDKYKELVCHVKP